MLRREFLQSALGAAAASVSAVQAVQSTKDLIQKYSGKTPIASVESVRLVVDKWLRMEYSEFWLPGPNEVRGASAIGCETVLRWMSDGSVHIWFGKLLCCNDELNKLLKSGNELPEVFIRRACLKEGDPEALVDYLFFGATVGSSQLERLEDRPGAGWSEVITYKNLGIIARNIPLGPSGPTGPVGPVGIAGSNGPLGPPGLLGPASRNPQRCADATCPCRSYNG